MYDVKVHREVQWFKCSSCGTIPAYVWLHTDDACVNGYRYNGRDIVCGRLLSSCALCKGSKNISCDLCGGSGKLECSSCKGTGIIKTEGACVEHEVTGQHYYCDRCEYKNCELFH